MDSNLTASKIENMFFPLFKKNQENATAARFFVHSIFLTTLLLSFPIFSLLSFFLFISAFFVSSFSPSLMLPHSTNLESFLFYNSSRWYSSFLFSCPFIYSLCCYHSTFRAFSSRKMYFFPSASYYYFCCCCYVAVVMLWKILCGTGGVFCFLPIYVVYCKQAVSLQRERGNVA